MEIGEGRKSQTSRPSGPAGQVAGAPGRTVAEAMIAFPKTLGVEISVADARLALEDTHVHMLLLTRDGMLHGTLVREDLAHELDPRSPADGVSRLDGRIIGPDRPLAEASKIMDATAVRRLAVTDHRGSLVGLLCLNRTRQRYCTESDVAARAGEEKSHQSP